MEADVKKANMPLKFISLLERWWELNRSGADKESGDIKAIVSFQREKEDRIYLFPARPLCREHLIFPLHLFFFLLLLQQQLLVIASRGSRPVQRHRTSYRQTDSTGKVHINSSLCLFLFISLHIRKKKYIKGQYEETEYKLYSIKTILSVRNVQKS